MLYFSYGSDLNQHTVIDFCKHASRPVPRRFEVMPAVLHNHRICFSAADSFFGGGAADVTPQTGKSVSGALMEVSNLGLETLSVMNGNRRKVWVDVKLFSGGRPMTACTFIGTSGYDTNVPPTVAYIQRMTEAAVSLGLSTMWIMHLQTFATNDQLSHNSPLLPEFGKLVRRPMPRRQPARAIVRPSIPEDLGLELVSC